MSVPGGEKKLSKKELAKIAKKKKKEAAKAARAAAAAGGNANDNAGGNGGGGGNKSSGKKPKSDVVVRFSHSEGAVTPVVTFIAATLAGGTPPEFEPSLSGADAQPALTTKDGKEIVGDVNIAKHVAAKLYDAGKEQADMDALLDLSNTIGATPKSLAQGLATLNSYLALRTYLIGSDVTLADIAIYSALDRRGVKPASLAQVAEVAPNVARFYATCRTNKTFTSANGRLDNIAKRARITAARAAKTDNYQELKGAVMGKVVTRFPPEPSGYLHIGHVKVRLCCVGALHV